MKAGAPLPELLAELGVDASPAFLESAAGKTFAVPTPVSRVYEVVWKLAGDHRWAVTFAGERLSLVSAEEAAAWWDLELSRRFSAS